MTRSSDAYVLPALVKQHPEIAQYWQRVLRPAIAGIADDGELAIFLNHQIGQWETEGRAEASLPMTAERLPAIAKAAHIIALLNDTLEILRLRIRARIAAAEAVLSRIAA